MTKIAASIASGPQTNLAETVRELEKAGADIIHFDIEDAHFVPEMRIGLKMIKELREITKLPFDVHLMVDNPEWFIPRLVSSGADMISVHYEACPYPRRTLWMIHENGAMPGLALNPKTSLPDISFLMDLLSFMLILTTDPEDGECQYLPSILQKVHQGKALEDYRDVLWQVDGGFTNLNIKDAQKAGADIVVSGRGVFAEGEIAQNIQKMREKL